MSVTVITDSTATLPNEMAARHGIVVVPIRVMVGDRSYHDGDISLEELLAATEPVTTSGPSPHEFADAIRSHSAVDGVVVITVAQGLAQSTFMSAQSAAAMIEQPVRVVDGTTAAGAQGLIALAAAGAAEEGASLDEVEAEAKRVIGKVRLVANLPSLEYLARSGHVPGAAAWAARWIGLNVVIELRDGKVRPLKPALSTRAAIDHMMDLWRRTRPAGADRLHLAILDAFDPEGAEEIRRRVLAETEPVEVFTGSFGTAMVVHSGPGVIGLAWWWGD
jgi:DegV family protein with EDD domain